MTKLAAVNEMLEWVGEAPIAAITVSGNDLSNESETILDRAASEVQATGWYCNTTTNLTISLATVRIVYTSGVGTFQYGETVTESTSGATGTYAFEETSGATSYIYLVPVSGTFTGNRTLTGGTSGATKVGTTYTLQTTSKLAIPSSYLTVCPSAEAAELAAFVQRGSFLWDTEANTYTFEEAVHAEVVELLGFTSLPAQLASLVTKLAASRLHSFKLRSVPIPPERAYELRAAWVRARQEDSDLRATLLTNTAEARQLKGNRNSIAYRSLQTPT